MGRFRKTPKADLKKSYPLYIEIGAILSLGLLILAFRAEFNPDGDFDAILHDQEVVQMEEILQTQQIEKPPPPPRPPILAEVPNDIILEEDEPEWDWYPDLDEPAYVPPPPAPATKEEAPEPDVFIIVEETPELIGGLAELQRMVEYPEIAIRAGVEGKVFIQFIVDEEGNVREPEVVKGIGAGCDQAAVDAILKAKFTPGKQRGRAVRVKMTLPITFKLR